MLAELSTRARRSIFMAQTYDEESLNFASSKSDGIVINRGDLMALLAATFYEPKHDLGKAILKHAQINAQDALRP